MINLSVTMDEFVRKPKRPRIVLDTVPVRRAAPRSPQTKKTSEIPAPPPAGILSDDQPSNVDIPPKPPVKPKRKFKIPLPHSRKQWIIFGVIAAFVLGGLGFASYWFFIKKEAPQPVTQVEPEPEPAPPAPTTEPSKMTGLEVEFAVNDRTVYAVQIENSPEARPQAGLAYADVVFEAIAEGGITRFNALFHDQQPESIGPVRSLRPYYIDWFAPFDAAIVHAGGSPEALNDINALGIKDLDHGPNGSYFTRIGNKYAPHNLYTTSAKMLELISKRGYTSPATASLERIVTPVEADEEELEVSDAPTPETTTPPANTINLTISSALYNVQFVYDKTNNSYMRNQAGGPHKDEKTGVQIAPNAVIVPVLTKSIHSNRIHTQYGTTGSGKVFVFQNGTVIEGTWTKPDRKAQWQLKNTAGETIKLVPGKVWFTIIDKAASVNFTP
jgi:hypothetical protein